MRVEPAPIRSQHIRTARKITTIAAASVGLLALSVPAFAAHEGTAYQGTLTELNDSGASGEAYLEVSQDGETLTARIDAQSLNLDGPHAMHIHGIVDEGDLDTVETPLEASACPTLELDSDGDGILTVAEGVPAYGDVIVSLTTEGDTSAGSALAVERFPAGTSIDYSREGIDIPNALKDELAKVHVVVHGIDEDGNGTLTADQEERSSLDDSLPREATAPALCGTLTAVSADAVQTGAGGTATDDGSGAPLAALIGLGALAVAGVTGLRSRGEQA